MNWIEFVIIFVMFVVTAWYVVQPMLTQPFSDMEDDKQKILLRRKQILMDQIKELEMDFEIGTLNKDDYLHQRNQLKHEISEILQQVKSA